MADARKLNGAPAGPVASTIASDGNVRFGGKVSGNSSAIANGLNDCVRAQTRRVAKLLEINAEPCAEFHPRAASMYGVHDGETVDLVTRRGRATFKVKLTPCAREDTVFVPFHWGDEQSVNRLTNAALDPISRMPEFKVCAVRVEKIEKRHE